jgi:hypothetical protein
LPPDFPIELDVRAHGAVAALRKLGELAAAAGDGREVQELVHTVFEFLVAVDHRRLAALRLAQKVHAANAAFPPGTQGRTGKLAARFGKSRQRIQQILAGEGGAKWPFVKDGLGSAP